MGHFPRGHNQLGDTQSSRTQVGDSPRGEKKLGALLQAAREQRQWSREYLARQINIHIRVLTQIENSDYKALPPLTYTRGFVLSLAQQLGLDKAEVLKLFRQETGDTPSTSWSNSPVVHEPGVRLSSVPLYVWLRHLRVLLVVGSLVAVGFVGLQVLQHYDGVQAFLHEAKTSKRLPAAKDVLKILPSSSRLTGATQDPVARDTMADRVFMRRALTKDTSLYLLNTQFDNISFRALTRNLDRAHRPSRWKSCASQPQSTAW